ncbi:hypothetical protein EYF80_018381 [Liparis tanakae]|uniref:Uncharacterized protein n=1 Tax=Liparis tanakae TaxID=230148 RepID=A0A4Z2I2H0_9TELE|nr:hypothetical protein EYF80_018381 [Liparis tanakae]
MPAQRESGDGGQDGAVHAASNKKLRFVSYVYGPHVRRCLCFGFQLLNRDRLCLLIYCHLNTSPGPRRTVAVCLSSRAANHFNS